jgi:CHAD domain-containing protein
MDDPRPASIHSLSRRVIPPARPVKARGARVHSEMLPDDAFRTVLLDCVAQMTANAGVLRNGRSAEGLHQLRVGLRRLEVALKSFSEAFEQPWLEELRGRAKVLSARLGPARDLDVFLDELLEAPARAFSGEEDRELLEPLRARAEALRDEAWKQASACVAGADFAVFLDDVAGLAQSRLPLAHDHRLKRMAGRILDRQEKRAKKRGRAARSHEEGDLHRLRIALKKLRYTAEFFAPLYRRKKVKRYLAEVKRLQECLGRLNDFAHARSVISQLGPSAQKDSAGLRFAAGMVQGWYGARRPRIVKMAMKRWSKLKRAEAFWA